MSDDLEVARIVITRTLTDDGKDLHEVETSPDMPLIEALGMLRMAEDSLIQHPPMSEEGMDDE